MFEQNLAKRLEQQRILTMLTPHSNKNFVQRILNPEGKPTLNLGNGNFATHKMAWTTVNGQPIVFPKVIQDASTGRLRELPIQGAVQHALQNNEFIPTRNAADADWLSSNYKKIWDMNGKNIRLAENLRNPLAGLFENRVPVQIDQNLKGLF